MRIQSINACMHRKKCLAPDKDQGNAGSSFYWLLIHLEKGTVSEHLMKL